MKHVKKYENYEDSDYDYTDSLKPITYEDVRSAIVEELENYELGEDENDPRDINDPKVQSDIDQLAKRVMSGFWDHLAYFQENHEDDLENIATGNFN